MPLLIIGEYMSVTLQSTAIGPVLVNGAAIISLSDQPALFDLLEDDPNLLLAIKDHIKSELNISLEELTEAIDMEIMYTPTKLYSYVTAYQQLMNVIQQWKQYMAARA